MTFSITGVRAEKYAAVPSLVFRLRLEEPAEVHAVLLRCQIRIEARRRPYSDQERAGLFELFGEPGRWRDTLRSLLWTQASVTVTGFRGAAEADLAVPCTYDFEVTAAKYLEAIRGWRDPPAVPVQRDGLSQNRKRIPDRAGAVGKRSGLRLARRPLA